MRSVAFSICLSLLAVGGCRQPEEEQPAEPAPAEEAPPIVPAAVTPADFAGLRWLEGRWRGTGDEVDPFFESYRFLNDSTILGQMYSDSTLAEVADSTVIALSGSELTASGAGASSVATAIDSESVHFVREGGATEFTWRTESRDVWTAHLRATILGETHERTYRMVRIPE